MDETAAQLEQEANAALASAPADPQLNGTDPGASVGPTAEDAERAYKMLGDAVLAGAFRSAAPAWEVQPGEIDRLGTALAKACAVWWPGGIPEKIAVILVVASVGYEIVEARRDPQTGQLRPRFHEIKKAEAPAVAATH